MEAVRGGKQLATASFNQFRRRSSVTIPPSGTTATGSGFALAAVAALVPVTLALGASPALVLVGGLAVFGAVFALNSAVHSFLILDYTDGGQVALNVGFYYMATAGGRLIGCLLSGVLYQLAGLAGCLWGTFVFAVFAAIIALALPRHALHPQRLAAAGARDADGD